ncbi:MAG: hypothetical protein R3B13_07815 [Polyangiaceae bacterium]
MLVSRAVMLGVLSVGLWSCNLLRPPPTPSYESLIVVEGDPGQPLAGATVQYNKKVVGQSDASGHVNLKLHGAEGHVISLGVTCPDGFQQPAKPVSVVLRRLAGGAKAEYRVSCPRAMRRVVIAVRATNGPNLPVVYLGREVTNTDANGIAHVALSVPPNQGISLKLDTSANERLSPKSPTNSFDVKNEDALFVLNQDFKVERPRRVYTRSKPTNTGPTPL